MKRNKVHYIALLPLYLFILLPLLASCGDHFDRSNNGDLDGYWQYTQVDTLATGGTTAMKERSMFLSVQGPLLTLTGKGAYLYQFAHHDDSLLLRDARYHNRGGGDSLVRNADLVKPFGLTRLDEHFHVDQLSGSRMVLSNTTYRLHFRKY